MRTTRPKAARTVVPGLNDSPVLEIKIYARGTQDAAMTRYSLSAEEWAALPRKVQCALMDALQAANREREIQRELDANLAGRISLKAAAAIRRGTIK
jgi:hypothetical protein